MLEVPCLRGSPPARVSRPSTLALICLLVAVVLVARSPRRLVGDGPEYLAMAERLSHLAGPSLPTEEARTWGLEDRNLRTADGRQVLPHIWFYSAIAAPVGAAVRTFGLDRLWAFTVVNVALYALALWLASRRYRATTVLFLGLGPIVWWLDKAHTEVFAYALLIATVTQLSTRPALALIAAAVLTAQNPQALFFFGAVVVWAISRWRATPGRLSWPRLLGVAGSVAVAASYPAYYLWRIGRVTPLVESGDLRIPALKTAGAVIWDLNIGLVANAPLVAVAVAIAVTVSVGASFRGGFARLRVEWLWAALSLPLLFAFAQTMNVNHGGTPGMSRYALWLLPLAAPLLDACDRQARALQQGLLAVVVAASAVWNAIVFSPSAGEGFLEPTAVADYQWRHHPDLIDPLPEIFAERVRHQESVNTFAAIDGCHKALLQSGQWPYPCAENTAPIPPQCQPDGILCYANRTSSGYAFHVVTRRGGWSIPRP